MQGIRNLVKLASMNNPAFPQAKNRGRPATIPALLTAQNGPRKNCSRFKPRNSLKNLDSDERTKKSKEIQPS